MIGWKSPGSSRDFANGTAHPPHGVPDLRCRPVPLAIARPRLVGEELGVLRKERFRQPLARDDRSARRRERLPEPAVESELDRKRRHTSPPDQDAARRSLAAPPRSAIGNN